jgi:hypothetical protein
MLFAPDFEPFDNARRLGIVFRLAATGAPP